MRREARSNSQRGDTALQELDRVEHGSSPGDTRLAYGNGSTPASIPPQSTAAEDSSAGGALTTAKEATSTVVGVSTPPQSPLVGPVAAISGMGEVSASTLEKASGPAGLAATPPRPTQSSAFSEAPPAAAPLATMCTPSPTMMGLADGVTPTRRSGRFAASRDGASTTDEDSMTKAMRRKVVCNLDYLGYSSVHSNASCLVGHAACAAQRLVFRGDVTFGGNGQGVIFPSWMTT